MTRAVMTTRQLRRALIWSDALSRSSTRRWRRVAVVRERKRVGSSGQTTLRKGRGLQERWSDSFIASRQKHIVDIGASEQTSSNLVKNFDEKSTRSCVYDKFQSTTCVEGILKKNLGYVSHFNLNRISVKSVSFFCYDVKLLLMHFFIFFRRQILLPTLVLFCIEYRFFFCVSSCCAFVTFCFYTKQHTGKVRLVAQCVLESREPWPKWRTGVCPKALKPAFTETILTNFDNS